MKSLLDRAVHALERLAEAAERIAVRLEQPSRARGRATRQNADAQVHVSDTDRAAARAAARRLGLHVREPVR